MIKAHAKKWARVYYYELETIHNGKPGRTYYFSYRNAGKFVWKKVGKLSEGYGPEVAAKLRAKTILGLTSGEEVKTPKEQSILPQAVAKLDASDISKLYELIASLP